MRRLEASGEVYKLSDVSQFPGAWIQGNGNLAISTLANGELWLQNNHGVVMRLNAQQAGITLSNGRYEIFIHMGAIGVGSARTRHVSASACEASAVEGRTREIAASRSRSRSP